MAIELRDDSVAVFLFSLVKRKERKRREGRWGTSLDGSVCLCLASGCAYTISTCLFSPVKRVGKKDDDYSMMLADMNKIRRRRWTRRWGLENRSPLARARSAVARGES